MDRPPPRSAVADLPLLSPLPPQPKSPWGPRTTWLLLHVAGLALLWAAHAWPWHSDAFVTVIGAVVALYAAASFMDPGFIDAEPDGERTRREQMEQSFIELPTCTHCNAPQPERAKHCHSCCRCVRRMDHHCHWLGNCVGEGNHVVFVCYLAAQALLLWWAAVCAAPVVFGGASGAAGDAGRAPPLGRWLASLCCFGLCLLLGLAVGTLLAFQTMLVLRGETTWENLRRPKINAAAGLPPYFRPYDRGACRNVLIFCRCAAPTKPTEAWPAAEGAYAQPPVRRAPHGASVVD